MLKNTTWILGLSLLLNTTVFGAIECGSQKYIVKNGESLSDIARKAYQSELKWNLIYYANQNIIGHNPSFIKKGYKLKIPCLENVKIQKVITPIKVNSSRKNKNDIKEKYVVEILSGDKSPPFLDKNEQNGGMITHIVKEALIAGGMNYSNNVIDDFSLHFKFLKNKSTCFDVGTNWYKPDCSRKNLNDKTKERCKFKFSKNLFSDMVAFYQKTGKPKPKSIKALHGKTICRPKGWMVFDLEEKGLIDGKTVELVWGESIIDCIDKLRHNTVHYISITKLSADLEIKKYKGEIVEIEDLVTPLTTHLIIHPNNSEGATIMYHFNKGLAMLKASGRLREIQTSHIINYNNKLDK